MKEYKEPFKRKGTSQNEIIVKEYSYEDWWNGAVRTGLQSGRSLIRSLPSKVYYYEFLPYEEHEKILIKAKELYNVAVLKRLALKKEIFTQRLEKSDAVELLFKKEIDVYEKLLFESKLEVRTNSNINHPIELCLPTMLFPVPNSDEHGNVEWKMIQNYDFVKISDMDILTYRKDYNRVVIEGVKDYTIMNSPNWPMGSGGNNNIISIEAIHRYLEWLKIEFEKRKNQIDGVDLDVFVEWLVDNPESAKIEYPMLFYLLETKIKGSHPIHTAQLIKKTPQHFKKWKKEYDDSFGLTRIKKLDIYIDVLKMSLSAVNHEDSIIRSAVLDVKSEIEEQLKFWSSKRAESNKPHESRTLNFLEEKFSSIHKNGWKYVFKSESDYNSFISLLVNFFEVTENEDTENEDTEIDDIPTIIPLQNKCKTRLGKLLGEIHKELSEQPLKSDEKYFIVIRRLSHFKDEKDLYKVLTR